MNVLLPTKAQFDRFLIEKYQPNHSIKFRNDSRLGSKDITSYEWWLEIKKAFSENSEESLKWCHLNLLKINIKWINHDY